MYERFLYRYWPETTHLRLIVQTFVVRLVRLFMIPTSSSSRPLVHIRLRSESVQLTERFSENGIIAGTADYDHASIPRFPCAVTSDR